MNALRKKEGRNHGGGRREGRQWYVEVLSSLLEHYKYVLYVHWILYLQLGTFVALTTPTY